MEEMMGNRGLPAFYDVERSRFVTVVMQSNSFFSPCDFLRSDISQSRRAIRSLPSNASCLLPSGTL